MVQKAFIFSAIYSGHVVNNWRPVTVSEHVVLECELNINLGGSLNEKNDIDRLAGNQYAGTSE